MVQHGFASITSISFAHIDLLRYHSKPFVYCLAMDQLPQELVDKITSFLDQDDLKNVLTLTHYFRYAAEMYSGAFREFTITNRNSEKFVTLYSGYRREYLRKVIFRPSFMPIANELDEDSDLEEIPPRPRVRWDTEGISTLPCRESENDLRSKDESFTHQIKTLFEALRTVEERSGNTSQRAYQLAIYSPVTLVNTGTIPTCLHHHNVSWRVHLLRPYCLPRLDFVRSLEVHNHDFNQKIWMRHDSMYRHFNDGNCELWQHYGHDLRDDGYHDFDRVESKLDLRVIIDLASRLSNLQYLEFKTGGFEWPSINCPYTAGPEEEISEALNYFERDWDGPRRDARHDFASSITSGNAQLPDSLKRVSLDFLNPLDDAIVHVHHEQVLPDLVGPLFLRDPFSSSLRIMSNNLRYLHIRAMVDESLFWPSNGDDAACFGPNLEVLEIMFHIVRPDGKWYFHGPKGENRDVCGYQVTDASYPPLETTKYDEEMEERIEDFFPDYLTTKSSQFCVVPHDTYLRPLLEAFAKSAIQMRFLKQFLIWTSLSWFPDSENCPDFDYEDGYSNKTWAIRYADPTVSQSYQPADACKTRQLRWQVDQWRPDAELHEMFKKIGRDKHGNDLREHWEALDPKHITPYLLYRDPGLDVPSDSPFLHDGAILPSIYDEWNP